MITAGFIGAGNMGSAIIRGIISGSLYSEGGISVYVNDSDATKCEALEKLGVKTLSTASEIFKECKYVFLCVKPQQLEALLSDVSAALCEENVIVSICAGIDEEYIREKTSFPARVIAVMPNTPLLLGEGATALSHGDSVSADEFETVREIFENCGEAVEISSDKMKEIIAINGSSPAFIYLFAKAFMDYAESVGIDPTAAKALFSKSLIGSAKMITDSGYTIDKLIEMVSSKGGTTIAGLEKLREGNLEETVKCCCKACTDRAYELAK